MGLVRIIVAERCTICRRRLWQKRAPYRRWRTVYDLSLAAEVMAPEIGRRTYKRHYNCDPPPVPLVISPKRVYRTRDGRLVGEGHPDAAFLHAAVGRKVPKEEYEEVEWAS